MERINVIIANHHEEQLKREAKMKGVSMSEVLRAAIDAYFAGKEGRRE